MWTLRRGLNSARLALVFFNMDTSDLMWVHVWTDCCVCAGKFR